MKLFKVTAAILALNMAVSACSSAPTAEDFRRAQQACAYSGLQNGTSAFDSCVQAEAQSFDAMDLVWTTVGVGAGAFVLFAGWINVRDGLRDFLNE